MSNGNDRDDDNANDCNHKRQLEQHSSLKNHLMVKGLVNITYQRDVYKCNDDDDDRDDGFGEDFHNEYD